MGIVRRLLDLVSAFFSLTAIQQGWAMLTAAAGAGAAAEYTERVPFPRGDLGQKAGETAREVGGPSPQAGIRPTG